MAGEVLGIGEGIIFGSLQVWVGVVASLTLVTQVITVLLYNGIVVPFYGG